MNDRCIYAHTKPNGEIFYIGRGTKKRAFTKSGRNNYWEKVANKYGYSVIILADNLSMQQSKSEEIELISHFKKFGKLTNLTDGGEGISGYKKSQEFCEKMRQIQLGRVWTKEEKQKVRETKLKSFTPIDPQSKRVLCIEANISFLTISAAERWLQDNGFPKAFRRNIVQNCLGKYKIAYGYHWKFI